MLSEYNTPPPQKRTEAYKGTDASGKKQTRGLTASVKVACQVEKNDMQLPGLIIYKPCWARLDKIPCSVAKSDYYKYFGLLFL